MSISRGTGIASAVEHRGLLIGILLSEMTKRKRANGVSKVQESKVEEPASLPLVRQSDEPVSKKVI